VPGSGRKGSWLGWNPTSFGSMIESTRMQHRVDQWHVGKNRKLGGGGAGVGMGVW